MAGVGRGFEIGPLNTVDVGVLRVCVDIQLDLSARVADRDRHDRVAERLLRRCLQRLPRGRVSGSAGFSPVEVALLRRAVEDVSVCYDDGTLTVELPAPYAGDWFRDALAALLAKFPSYQALGVPDPGDDPPAVADGVVFGPAGPFGRRSPRGFH